MALAAISLKARAKLYGLLARSLLSAPAARKMFSTSPSNGNLVAVCQVTSTSDKAANFETCSALIHKAQERGAKVVFLPEAVDFIAEKKAQAYELAEPLDGPIVTKYKELAKKLGVWLSLGSVHVKDPNELSSRIYNTHVVINSTGDTVGTYSKVHLFDVDVGTVRSRESDYTIAGSMIPTPVATPVGKAMMRTRAIENQCYVVSAAQIGQHNAKRSSYGHALVVDPWGCIVAQCSDVVGLALAEINHDLIKKVRRLPDKDQYQFGQVTLEASQLFYKSSLSMAFVNKMPVLPGHVLVAPIRPALRLSDLSSEEVQDLFLVVQRVQSVVEKQFGASSSTVSIQASSNDGPDAGRSINHIHVHVLPRKPGDFSHNDNVYVKLQEHDKDDKKPKRSVEEMAEEAQKLRALFH
ncbi:hypothetical protein HPB50_003845 [Hyalomma asiaticum]|uniref:Uncharacterized protein n=1 Tax=Hyalomma asiaticum TaxID=266040 RepID=A0ACB7RIQ2_HYAAI|nr:hypothetical protein HPB50_003845 [Hyalomma asiaticum]